MYLKCKKVDFVYQLNTVELINKFDNTDAYLDHVIKNVLDFSREIYPCYFNDWNSSFSSSDSPLSERFVEEYNGDLLKPKKKLRGFTSIHTIKNEQNELLSYSYLKNQCDLFRIKLNKNLLPYKSHTIFIEYTLQIQNERFTKYGVTNKKDYFLNYWYITPVVFSDSEWKLYSNKNLDDYYTPKSNIKLTYL